MNATNSWYNTRIRSYLAQGVRKVTPLEIRCVRPVGNALELELCKIPTIGTQSENQQMRCVCSLRATSAKEAQSLNTFGRFTHSQRIITTPLKIQVEDDDG